LVTDHAFSLIQALDAFNQVRLEFLDRSGRPRQIPLLVGFQAAKSGADDFARSLVEPAAHFLCDEFFQLRRQRHIHNTNPSNLDPH